MHVRFLNHRRQGLLGAVPRPKDRGDEAALAEFGDVQFDGIQSSIPLPLSIAVALCNTLLTALVMLHPDFLCCRN